MKSKSLLQRLGFVTDLVGQPLPDEMRKPLSHAIPKTSRSHFGRPKRRDGDIGYVAAWGLFVNARKTFLPKSLASGQARARC